MIAAVCLLCTLASCSCTGLVTSSDERPSIVGDKPSCKKLKVVFDRNYGDGFLVLGPNVPCKVSIKSGYTEGSEYTSQWFELADGILLAGDQGYVEVTVYPQKKAEIPWVGGYIDSLFCDSLYVSTNFSENSVTTPTAQQYGCYVDGRARPALKFAPVGSQTIPAGVSVYMYDEYGVKSAYYGYSPRTGVFGVVRGYPPTKVQMKVISTDPTDEVTLDSVESSKTLMFVNGTTGDPVAMNPGRCKSYTKCEGLPGFNDLETGEIIGIAIGVILIVLLVLLILTCLYWHGKLTCLILGIQYLRHKGWKDKDISSSDTEDLTYEDVPKTYGAVKVEQTTGILERLLADNPDSVYVTTSCETCAQIPTEKLLSDWHLQLPEQEGNSWVSFDFGQNPVCLESYSVKMIKNTSAPWFWQVEGSNDEKFWELIDNRSEKIEKDVATYTCSVLTDSFFRYIRFRQTLNTTRGHDLNLNGLEFYGKTKSAKDTRRKTSGQ